MTGHPIVAQVEIKANVAGDDVDAAEQLLDLKDRQAKRRTIWFYEHLHGRGGRTALPLLQQAPARRDEPTGSAELPIASAPRTYVPGGARDVPICVLEP